MGYDSWAKVWSKISSAVIHGEGNVFLWRFLSASGVDNLFFIDGITDQQVYLNFLKEDLMSIVDKVTVRRFVKEWSIMFVNSCIRQHNLQTSTLYNVYDKNYNVRKHQKQKFWKNGKFFWENWQASWFSVCLYRLRTTKYCSYFWLVLVKSAYCQIQIVGPVFLSNSYRLYLWNFAGKHDRAVK